MSVLFEQYIFACENNHINSLKALNLSALSMPDLVLGLVLTATNGHIEVFTHIGTQKTFLEDPNYKNQLIVCWNKAVRHGHTPFLEQLLNFTQVRKNKRNFLSLLDLKRSYHLSCQYGHVETLRLLDTQFEQLKEQKFFAILKRSEQEALQSASYQDKISQAQKDSYDAGFKKAFHCQKDCVLDYLIFERNILKSQTIKVLLEDKNINFNYRQKIQHWFDIRDEQKKLDTQLQRSIDLSPKNTYKI